MAKVIPLSPLYMHIGKQVILTIEANFRDKTGNNYDLSDFIGDFSGTQEELDRTLIKMAAELV